MHAGICMLGFRWACRSISSIGAIKRWDCRRAGRHRAQESSLGCCTRNGEPVDPSSQLGTSKLFSRQEILLLRWNFTSQYRSYCFASSSSSIKCLPIYLTIYLSLHVPYYISIKCTSLSIYLSIYVPIYLPIYFPIYVPIYLSIDRSMYL